MSRYSGNADRCPGCGMTYRRFRTGMTYYEIYLMLWSHDSDSSTWKHKGRSSVLGLWHSIKKSLWARHTESDCTDLVPF